MSSPTRQGISAWCLPAIWFACALSGCGVAVGPNLNGTQDSTVITSVFADDADSAMAALPIVETELLVQPYPGADAESLGNLYALAGAYLVTELDEIQVTVLDVQAGQLEAVAETLAASKLIESIHKNYIFEAKALPDDPMFAQQPHLEQINAPQAWDVTVGSEGIIIGIVDTGVEADHPDLADKIIDGWNVYEDNPDFGDQVGHGTQVAGVAAATANNGIGVAGVSWNSPIIAVRVSNDSGQSTARHIAAGILWALGQGAKVINVSFAPLWSNSIVRSAAELAFNRGALVVISAGNDGEQRDAVGYRDAIFVAAVNSSNVIASFSDRGPFVDLVAPGSGIRSTALDGEYGMGSGTSFAAPIVAGVVALAWSVNPDLRPVSIIEALHDSADDLGVSGQDSTYGYGIVNARGAVDLAALATFVPDVTPPTIAVNKSARGSTLSGRSIASVTATDDVGVADVVMFVDGIAFATDTRAPYRFVMDTADFATGTHELGFVATDLAGNASEMRSITIWISSSFTSGDGTQAPAVTYSSPAPNSQVTGDVSITASAESSAGLATVEWLIDGESVFATALSGNTSGLSYLWRTSEVESGTHTITIIITDRAGNRTTANLDLNKQ